MDKLMMNKLDDMEMELDDKEMGMVAGGTPGVPPPGLIKRKKRRTYGDAVEDWFKKGFKKGVNAVENAVDNLLIKVFGPPRRR